METSPSCEPVGPAPAWDLALLPDVTSTEGACGQPVRLGAGSSSSVHLWCPALPWSIFPTSSGPDGKAVTRVCLPRLVGELHSKWSCFNFFKLCESPRCGFLVSKGLGGGSVVVLADLHGFHVTCLDSDG